jgi:hypothetical protein
MKVGELRSESPTLLKKLEWIAMLWSVRSGSTASEHLKQQPSRILTAARLIPKQSG